MPKTLLLADDSVTIQKVVGITFASEDVELITVDNGDDALARVKETKPDVVLADVNMPGLNGYELCRAIRADADIASTPVLLLTGSFESFDESRARDAGANAHIAKPFEAQALVDAVARLFEPSAAAPAALEAAAPEPLPVQAEASAAADDFSFDDLDFDAPPPLSAERTQVLADTPSHAGLSVAASEPAATGAAAEVSDDGVLEIGEESAADDALYGELSFGEPLGESTASTSAESPAVPLADPSSVADDATAPESGTESQILGDPMLSAEDDPLALNFEEATLPSDAEPQTREPEPAEELLFVDESPSQTGPLADDETPVPTLTGLPAIGSPASPVDASAMREVLEKLAWEAFGPLSEQLVRQLVEKLEAIAWDVVPQLAERLIREELARMKSNTAD